MKILIVKTSALGDIIQAFQVLQYLRECYPYAQIDWVAERGFADLIEAHPSVDHVIKIDTKKWRANFWKKEVRNELKILCRELRQNRYELLFDLQANLKSSFLCALVISSKKIGFGRKTVHEWPNLLFTNVKIDPPEGKNICEDYLYLAQHFVGIFDTKTQGVKLKVNEAERLMINAIRSQPNLQGSDPIIMVCTGSNWPNKQLSKTTLLSFLKLIAENLNCRFLFVWGVTEEKKLAEEIIEHFPKKAYVAEKLGLGCLQNLMAEVDLVIAMDSLPLHLAATTSTPTYSVFGASSAKKFKPAGEMHAAFQGQCPFGKIFVKRCPILRTCATGACIKNIEGEELYRHFIKWWNK